MHVTTLDGSGNAAAALTMIYGMFTLCVYIYT